MALATEIRKLDLEPISFLAAVEYGWSLEKTDATELEYRAYLQAIYERPNDYLAPPSRDCDLYWHMHVLDTLRYGEDCMRIFGRFVHHFPYSGARGSQDLKQQRQRLRMSQRIVGQILAELSNSAPAQTPETTHETATHRYIPPHPRQPHRLHHRTRPRRSRQAPIDHTDTESKAR